MHHATQKLLTLTAGICVLFGTTVGFSAGGAGAATPPAATTAVARRAGTVRNSVTPEVSDGGIAGVVTADSADLADICVYASDGSGDSGDATTARDGTYTITDLPPNSYTVEFDDCDDLGPYATQYYDDQASESSADPVVVASRNDHTVDRCVDAVGRWNFRNGDSQGRWRGPGEHLRGGRVTGSATTERPSPRATGPTRSPDCPPAPTPSNSRTDEDTGGYLDQWYDNKTSLSSAVPVTVVAATTTPSIDTAMVVGGMITGTVTAAVGGADLSDICVEASDGLGDYGDASTASNGTYSVTGLPTGTYTVEFSDCEDTGGYLDQWYDNKLSQTSAVPVTVTAGTATPSISTRQWWSRDDHRNGDRSSRRCRPERHLRRGHGLQRRVG